MAQLGAGGQTVSEMAAALRTETDPLRAAALAKAERGDWASVPESELAIANDGYTKNETAREQQPRLPKRARIRATRAVPAVTTPWELSFGSGGVGPRVWAQRSKRGIDACTASPRATPASA